MKIVYQGSFLKDALKGLGHDVFDIRLREDVGINAQIEAICPDPDLVLLELWGDFKLPADLHLCASRLAAWCIDSILNEFWLDGLLDIFDDVFVDQKTSVAPLATERTAPIWLPLCANDDDFRNSGLARVHDISFVGRITEHRQKRTNLLKLIERRFTVHQVQGVSIAQMQDIFSKSKVVLNENFFPGLTLRVFQGLASGGLVFTEADSPGLGDFFVDGQHLVCYDPHNLYTRLDSILENYDSAQDIALEGQRECKASHTATHRATSLLLHIASTSASGWRFTADGAGACAFSLARSLYLSSYRFGGSFATSIKMLDELAKKNNEVSIKANGLLGVIYARIGRMQTALGCLEQAACKSRSIAPFLNIALIHLNQGKNNEAREMLERGLAACPETARLLAALFPECPVPPANRPRLLFFMAQIYFALGRLFFPGFSKPDPDSMPDTAFELARQAWTKCHDPVMLDLMLDCLKPFKMEPELLPELTAAIQSGLTTDAQILRTAELAAAYYDMELAHAISAAFSSGKK